MATNLVHADYRMALIMCHPDAAGYPTPAQKKWLDRFIPPEQVIPFAAPELPMVEAWDLAIHKHVINAPGHITELLIIHDDTTPTKESDPIWESMAPFVCCRFDHPTKPRLWRQRTAFHLPMCRFQRQVFSIIPPPWFDWYRHPDTGEPVMCNCTGFKRKAWRYGLAAGRPAGFCIHENLHRFGANLSEVVDPDGPPRNMSLSLWKKRRRPQPCRIYRQKTP